MAQVEVPNKIICFGYPASPYACRVKDYLALRNIAYAECIQPELLPRPDLNALGLNYRRVPVLSIGRDIYLDSGCIIARLEALFPPSAEHPALSTPQTVGLGKVYYTLVNDVGGIFMQAALLMTPEFDLIQRNPGFVRDRDGLFGIGSKLEDFAGLRPDGVVRMREVFQMVEDLLCDGRKWIAGTEELSIADFELEWPFHWMLSALEYPKELFNAELFPKTFAWTDKFRASLEAATEHAPSPVHLQGDEAVRSVNASEYTDDTPTVDSNDPMQLEEGTKLQVFPTDSGGFTHQDRGRLVKLTRDEVAIAVQSQTGQEVRLHAPRWKFRIESLAA